MDTIKYLSLKYRESWICGHIEAKDVKFDGCWNNTKTLFLRCRKNFAKKGDRIIVELKSKTDRWNVKRA